MKQIIYLFLLAGAFTSFFTGCSNENENEPIYTEVEKMPVYPGGAEALLQFVSKEVKYPEQAREEGIEGRVVTSFVIDSEGHVSDVEVLRGVNPLLDEEAVRVVKEMSDWIPGEHEGKKVSVKYTMPIVFTLSNTSRSSKRTEDENVFTVVENMPQFPGGDKALMEFISTNIVYPENAKENKIAGRVVLNFIVNKDGSVSDAIVIRSVDPELDKEALRVINMMPVWRPGEQGGKKVAVRYTVPVVFRLQ